MVALVLIMSGCLGDEPDPLSNGPPTSPTGTTGSAEEETLPIDTPRPLAVGDWWKYRVESQDPSIGSYDLTLLIATETADAYELTAVEADRVNVTFFTHLPSLGPVRKSDLAVTRHGNAVPFFSFPLKDGKTWEAEVRGPWTATANLVDLPLGTKTVPGWRIEYTSEGALVHVVEWSPEVGWLLREETYFGDTAGPRHQMRLTDWGKNWTGTARTYFAKDAYVKAHAFNATSPGTDAAGQETFEVSADAAWLLLGAFMGGTGSTCSYGYGAPGTGLPTLYTEACGDIRLQWYAAATQAGSWRAVWATGGREGFILFESFEIHSQVVTLE